MITEKINISVEGSLEDSHLLIYRWENSKEIKWKKRPLILMCPGGGYERTSDREADPVAVQFLSRGYHVAILRYSCKPATYPTALLEAFIALKLIRENADAWMIDEDKIYIQGCSAGGHLAASVACFWNKEWVAKKLGCGNEILKPNGLILFYPVITSGKFAHRGSFNALLDGEYTDELLELNSLEKQVNPDMPKTFIWHTYTDDCVPVENSLMLISAMKKYDIPVEFHMYTIGSHGLSTADRMSESSDNWGVQKEVRSWMPLLLSWIDWANGD